MSMRFTWQLLVLASAVCLCLWSSGVESHPQCLNFAAPFRDEQVSYCTEYKDYGCCWRVTDRRARKTVDYFLEVLSRKADSVVVDECKPYLRNISCLFCNPYAAHLFDVEQAQVRRPFPWLCEEYCVEAYRHCHQVLLPMFYLQHKDFGLTQSPANSSVLQADARSFCQQVNPTSSPYCYPQILSGPQLPDVDPEETSGGLDCVCAQPVATGLRNPVIATHSRDKTGRLFIVEQLGVIRILTAAGVLLEQPFLDLTSQVLISSRRGDERGLLGLTFHPNYTSNGKFYVYYSTSVNFQHWSRVSEFTVSSVNSNVANVSSERELWSVSQPASNHNGGELLFHQGHLLIFLGDGGGGGDTFNNGLNLRTWLGSILRIDVNSPDPSRGTAYSIPPDNPFLGRSDARPEIFAYGLRNPWRCSVDRGDPVTGEGRDRIFCGDVGQNRFEEVDIIVKGGNYGWRAFEGNECFDGTLCHQNDTLGPFLPPIDTYSHSVGVSITGGFVYRGCLYPNLRGVYIFADYAQRGGRNDLFALRQVRDSAGRMQWQRSTLCMGDSATCIGDLVGTERQRFVLSFGEDEDGELYVLTASSAEPTSPLGAVYHIVDPARRESPSQCRTLRSF